MYIEDRIWVGQGTRPCNLLLKQANRHGIIAGASGTGKTVTLKVLAEGFSQAGVPVFLADVKGDVTGMAQGGDDTPDMQKRIRDFGIEDFEYQGCPVRIWDMLGGTGIPVRISISDMGPVMLSRMLGLTNVQEGVLNIVFRVADDQGLLMIDLKDLRSMLNYVADHAKEYETTYGKVSSQSVGAILRSLISVEDEGGDMFFGEPALDLEDFMQIDDSGHGYVNILNASKLIQSPQIYAMFLLWMLSELFETLPEVGDMDKPKLVFFFDEAHLLFNDMPKPLVDKVIQVVKLIRSKGVGVYFITQSPSDIPDEILAQLSNRIQHGLRAYTPQEQKALKAAARSFRVNDTFDSEAALQELQTGEALISLLNEDGQPAIVERAKVLPPECRMGAADADAISQVIVGSAELLDKYGNSIDRESAYEVLSEKQNAENEQLALEEERKALQREREELEAQKAKQSAAEEKEAEKEAARAQKEAERAAEKAEREAQKQRDQMTKTINSVIGQIGRETGRQLIRGLFGALKR